MSETNRPDRVLIVGDFADVTGGQAKVAIDSARLLAEAGIAVTFFAATGPVSPLLSHPGIEVVCLNQHTILSDPNRLRAMRSGLWNSAALSALKTEIARHDPARTILHCHGWAKALSPSVGPVLTGGTLPVLYTMHEYFLACPNGGFFDYRRNEICTRRPLGPSCLTTNCDVRRFSHKMWRVARSAVLHGPGAMPRGMTDIAYISQTQLDALRSYLPERARLHHLPNPVPVSGRPVDAGANDTFVFVGRMSAEKGALIFAEAAAEAGVPALFVGDGPEAETIRDRFPQARITGWVAPGQVAEHLSEARALVFPSLWYECQPLVPVEALARGIPVIAGRWSAASEVVDHGRNGIIYDRPDATSLAEAIRAVTDVTAFDGAAVARAFAPETHLARLLDIYSGQLARFC